MSPLVKLADSSDNHRVRMRDQIICLQQVSQWRSELRHYQHCFDDEEKDIINRLARLNDKLAGLLDRRIENK